MEEKDIWQISISAVSAIATLLAVFVALWQTKYSNRKRLKIECNDVSQFYESILGSAQEMCINLKVVNIGNREITLVREGIHFSNGFEFQIISQKKSFPISVKIEESLPFLNSLSELINAINKSKEKIGKTNKKMCFFVEDTTGKRYSSKTKHTIDYYISELDKK